ncbi:MAG TPA: oligosaccharide flippase family protein [Rhodothermales bacterium]
MSVVQVVVVGISFVVLYRFVRDSVGAAEFGVWALVLTTTSVAGLANLGFSSGTVKFVAQYLAAGDHEHVSVLIQTAVLTVAAAVGVVVVFGYPLARALLGFLIEPASYVPIAIEILPYALASFWMTAVAGVVQSSLDGHHRVFLRNLLLIGSSIAYLVLAFVLVPRGGLIGLALAQVLQAAALLLVGWLTLRRVSGHLPLVPFIWRRGAFREMLGFALNIQVISISQILFVPVTKALVSKFGGVAAVASFEFAQRMVIQLRALLATAHEALVPAISDLNVREPDRLRGVYVKSFRLLLYILIPSLPLLIALTPLVSRLWIGSLDPDFVLFADLLFAGWFLNLLANPAYFANVGTGDLRWNVLGHLIIGAASASLGLLLGLQFGAAGVVAAAAAGLLLGSYAIAHEYQRRLAIGVTDILDSSTWLLAAAAAAGILVLLLGSGAFGGARQTGLGLMLAAFLYAALVAIPLWRHPMRREIVGWLASARTAGGVKAP